MKTVETIGGVSFFTCDAEEEQEANWLAGLPAACHAGCSCTPQARHGLRRQIAEQFNVSEQMAAFRLRTTGVQRQLGASRDRR